MTASSSLFLVNGNHEEAARFLLDGTANNAAVLAGKARTTFFSLPAPDGFYSGDAEPVEHVIDPYWHSPVQVDANPGGGGGGGGGNGGRRRQPGGGNAARGAGRNRDLWSVTLGDAQYRWLKQTLEASRARYKFVFAHHVMGTGRGGIEIADFYEWAGGIPAAARRSGRSVRGGNCRFTS